jgi:hypothetical protein
LSHQSLFVLGIFEIGFTGLKPQSSRTQPPK